MNKFTVFALVCVFALGACAAPTPSASFPTPDVAGTVDSMAKTAEAETLTAQPSPTVVPVQDTLTPLPVDASATPTTVVANTDTPTLVPNLTTTPATATSGVANPTTAFTSTATLVPGLATVTPTLGVLTYGTLPPANTPYTSIRLVNLAKRQAYISLQVVTDQGYTIIEHPVKGTLKVKIPVGSYTYVAWVGGRQFSGYFNVVHGDEPTINIYPDKIEVIN